MARAKGTVALTPDQTFGIYGALIAVALGWVVMQVSS